VEKIKQVLLKLFFYCIRGYQYAISPFLGDCCRFEPSCSAYLWLAIEQHGFWRGVFMGLRRLARCHPLCEGGYDPP